MEKYQQRMLYEYTDLRKRISKLESFISSDECGEKVSEEELDLLKKQKEVMLNYSEILENRIVVNNLGKELSEVIDGIKNEYNDSFIDRHIILGKAYEDCMREMYRKSQPSADYDEYIRKLKNGEIDRDVLVYNRHYLSRDEYEYILEKYKDAYNIRATWYDNVDVVKEYFNDNAIKDKWIPDKVEEDGFTHPGYRGYEKLPDFKDTVLEILKGENLNEADLSTLSQKIKEAVIKRIELCQKFYRFDREESGFEISVGLGASPTPNKNTVKEYWKSQGVDIEFEDRDPKYFWEIDKYGHVLDEDDDYITEEEEIE